MSRNWRLFWAGRLSEVKWGARSEWEWVNEWDVPLFGTRQFGLTPVCGFLEIWRENCGFAAVHLFDLLLRQSEEKIDPNLAEYCYQQGLLSLQKNDKQKAVEYLKYYAKVGSNRRQKARAAELAAENEN